MSEIVRARNVDTIMLSIKTAPSTAAVLAAVQAHLTSMTHRHMLQALRTLFELHKANKYVAVVCMLYFKILYYISEVVWNLRSHSSINIQLVITI